jgi:hypothetical protein
MLVFVPLFRYFVFSPAHPSRFTFTSDRCERSRVDLARPRSLRARGFVAKCLQNEGRHQPAIKTLNPRLFEVFGAPDVFAHKATHAEEIKDSNRLDASINSLNHHALSGAVDGFHSDRECTSQQSGPSCRAMPSARLPTAPQPKCFPASSRPLPNSPPRKGRWCKRR